MAGFILHEDARVVVIATDGSENRKTGDMMQIWILCRDVSPVDAVKTGQDAVICGSCPHRGYRDENAAIQWPTDRTCYVNVAQGPGNVWRAYQRGSYTHLQARDYARVFSGRAVRFGAYGDPVLIPLAVFRRIAAAAGRWTGYTHQWRKRPAYRQYLMASCDSMADYLAAKGKGWRTFRVSSSMNPVQGAEILCPASDEAGKKTQCAKCGLCNGTRTTSDVRKDIMIPAHGHMASKFVQIEMR